MRLPFYALLTFACLCGFGQESTTEKPAKVEQATDTARCIKDLDSEDYLTRESAHKNMAAAGAQIEADLKKAAQSDLSPEVKSRVQRLLEDIEKQRIYGSMTEEQIEISKLPFSTNLAEDGNKADCRIYSVNNYALIDIGKVRIAIKGFHFPGSSMSSSVYLRSRGGVSTSTSSIGGIKISLVTSEGQTTGDFAGIKFTIKDYQMTMGANSVKMDKSAVFFSDRKGQLDLMVELDRKKEGEAKKKEEDPKEADK